VPETGIPALFEQINYLLLLPEPLLFAVEVFEVEDLEPVDFLVESCSLLFELLFVVGMILFFKVYI
jgi:hypothetical protein